MGAVRKSRPLWDRFWEKVDAEGDCWEWTASRQSSGYGQFWTGERLVGAHRMAWELLVGPIPEGMQIDHLCKNKLCVNPDHLEPVTAKENLRRGVSHRRRTHCRRGHEFTPENTMITTRGTQECLTCRRAHSRAWKRRRREQLVREGK